MPLLVLQYIHLSHCDVNVSYGAFFDAPGTVYNSEVIGKYKSSCRCR